ncbi:retrovirus-related pol polyprotein from transposon 17.6 [Plakobranchus ocellatus]|uniref:Retrovirus-related pol polyprotein from transposon 17.6 n=1 Tax=Plakobranchus ocellatus TaxID=259542 RepID=A0AAV4D0J6_9GAST|nr:retrovirus-related pol polyprotein from transposon 17.6 [Plakobranchus ocellatus]
MKGSPEEGKSSLLWDPINMWEDRAHYERLPSERWTFPPAVFKLTRHYLDRAKVSARKIGHKLKSCTVARSEPTFSRSSNQYSRRETRFQVKSRSNSRRNPNVSSKKVKTRRVFHISESGNPNSCLIHVGKTKWRTFIDSGPEVCCVDSKVRSKLKNPPKVNPVNQHLQGACGSPLKVLGVAKMGFRLGEREYMHPFYVIKNASRNWIIGCDFLKQQKARIYFDLEKLRLNDEYINLDQDIRVASVVRLAHDVTIPPQTSVRVSGKLKTRAYYEPGFICQVNQDARSCIRDEPGLLLANSLSKLDNRLQVPEDYRQEVTTILKKNADVFAASDTDFGLTNTVTMTIDTDDILIFSDTLEQHFHHLQTVLDRIRAHGLKLKLKKCSFLQKETSFLGFRVSNKGVQAEESKIEAIRSLSPPASVREVRSFIAVCRMTLILLNGTLRLSRRWTFLMPLIEWRFSIPTNLNQKAMPPTRRK